MPLSLDQIKHAAPTWIPILVVLYLIFQLMTGEKGLLTDKQRAETLKVRQSELKKLQAEHRDLYARVRYLRNDSLSRDLLSERARVILGFEDPKDYVIRVYPGDGHTS